MHLYDEVLQEHLVLINSSQLALRQRFTLAHEIGHARFDRSTIVESLEKPQSEYAPEEKRANAFASELLMPEAALKRWAPAQPWGQDIDEIADLAIYFGLSFESTLWKLYNARLVDNVDILRSHRPLISSDRRTRLREAGDGRTEYPEGYTKLVKEGLSRGLVSQGRADELLESEDEF